MSSVRIVEFHCPPDVGPERIVVDWEKDLGQGVSGYVAKEVWASPESEIRTVVRFFDSPDQDRVIRKAHRHYRYYRKLDS
jgi:hypothetical protein